MRFSRFPITRRQLLVGAISVVPTMSLRFPHAVAQILPEGNTLLWEVASKDRARRIDDIAGLADGSFVLSLTDVDESFSRIVTRHDAQGNLLWRTELDESELSNMVRSIVPAIGDSGPGLYVSSGFKKVWRLGDDGSQRWERDLFDYAGIIYPQAMVAHPSGGVLVGGIASRPAEELGECANCAIVRLAEHGSPMWTWWRDHTWHAFATTIAVTDHGTVIAHMMSYNPATGSQGDRCEGQSLPQWTVWIDPHGRTIRAQPWPANRRAEAMALDRIGRLVFYGRTRPELQHFFQICDAEAGVVLAESIFGEPEPDATARKWYLPSPRPMDVSDRGVSVALASGCAARDTPWGTDVYTLTPEGPVDSAFLSGVCWVGPKVVSADGTALLVADDRLLIRIPLPQI